MNIFNEFDAIISKDNVSYDYSSVQFDLSEKLSNDIINWGIRNIPDEFLYTEGNSFGREDEIHCTIKYGLKTNDIDKITAFFDKIEPFSIKLDRLDSFKQDSHDVLIIKVNDYNKSLNNLHNKLKDKFKNIETYPDYIPHVTIAYLKKGYVDDLIKTHSINTIKVKVTSVTFSSSTDEKTVINLKK